MLCALTRLSLSCTDCNRLQDPSNEGTAEFRSRLLAVLDQNFCARSADLSLQPLT